MPKWATTGPARGPSGPWPHHVAADGAGRGHRPSSSKGDGPESGAVHGEGEHADAPGEAVTGVDAGEGGSRARADEERLRRPIASRAISSP